MKTGAHPSFYALDRVRLGEPASAEERQHIAACPGCAGYVEAHPTKETATAPPWLSGVRLAAPADRPTSWRAFWTAGTALALAAGMFLLWPRALPHDSVPGIREKGNPAVQVFVKRGERVFLLNGRAIRPGDRLRVEVNGGGFGFVSVAGRSPGERKPVLLYDGALASGAHLLPLSFRVDAEGKQEILSVIFGRRPVPLDLHARAEESGQERARDGETQQPEGASTWRQILVLEKEVP